MPSGTSNPPSSIETARLELDRTHRAARAMDAAEMRRGLELAAAALQDFGDHDAASQLRIALQDLAEGRLEHMERIVEDVRKSLL